MRPHLIQLSGPSPKKRSVDVVPRKDVFGDGRGLATRVPVLGAGSQNRHPVFLIQFTARPAPAGPVGRDGVVPIEAVLIAEVKFGTRVERSVMITIRETTLRAGCLHPHR